MPRVGPADSLLHHCGACATLYVMSHPTQDPIEKSHARALVEERFGATIRELLQRMYVEQGHSQLRIAEAFGVERRTVARWMTEEGIPTRDRRALASDPVIGTPPDTEQLQSSPAADADRWERMAAAGAKR